MAGTLVDMVESTFVSAVANQYIRRFSGEYPLLLSLSLSLSPFRSELGTWYTCGYTSRYCGECASKYGGECTVLCSCKCVSGALGSGVGSEYDWRCSSMK
jgi:hypothetical protein